MSPSRILAITMLIGLGGIVFIGLGGFFLYRFICQPSPKPQPVAAAKNEATKNAAPDQKPVMVTAAATPPPAAPGTVISVEEVLSKVDQWIGQHPTYHLKAVTALTTGTVTGDMDVFAYSNAVDGRVTACRADLYNPDRIEFTSVKKDGKLKFYFPATDQLIEQDMEKTVTAMPLFSGVSSYKGLMKLSKNSFAEASADLMVATLVLNTVDMKMAQLPSEDIYLSVRANNQGKLLGVGQQVGAGRLFTSVDYLTFDAATVAREAPGLPPGRVALTNKSFEQVMQDETKLVSRKPLGKKI